LKKFGVDKISELEEENFSAVIAEAKKAEA